MAAPSNTAGQSKYGQRNSFDGLRILLPAPTAAGQQVYPRRSSAFDGLIIAPPAPASTSTECKPSCGMEHLPYDVFINHRGEDVKYTVATNIYNKLTAIGLRVFLDKDELKLGDFFPKTLEEAIRGSSLHIAIFSRNYADSPWCLAELACMLETGIKFIPIFYHVQPCTLRWAIKGKGIYADAFSKDEMKSRYSSEQLQSWKLALHNATLHIGETIYNQGDEEKAVTNVVNLVLKELKKDRLDVAKHPVGLDEAEHDFHDKIPLQSAGVQIVGIYGMGGMGKTTLAKRLYNTKCSTIAKSSFLSDVRDAAKNQRLHEKQKELLEDLDLESKDFKNVDKGKEILKSRLKSVSVLIVLDDVDHTDQLDALLPARENLGHGSVIIVTTRELSVLRAGGISTKYQMRTLNDAHAKQLFCLHAFGQPSPLLEFNELTQKFIDACHGLPLSLKVIGGLLCGESSQKIWQSQLDKLSRIVPDDIKLRLKVSYDALDKEEKEMFLDVACFFIGWKSSRAIAVWDGSEWNGLHGWQRLLNKCLVELNEYDCIRMHDHLRDLGREIANQQSPYRLWSKQQIIEIQPQQEAIRIRGMANAVGDNCCPRQGKIMINTSQGERILAPGTLGLKIFVGNGDFINEERSELSRDLVCFECDGFDYKNLPSWFSLKKLKILELYEPERLEDLWERDADAPLQLSELVIDEFSCFQRFPRSIAHLKNLKKISIEADVRNDDYTLRDLPQEFCNLHSLEHLEIKWCSNLSYLPSNFGRLTNLQHLDLTGCTTLKMLPDSCKKLTLLEYLKLSFCYKLTFKSELHILANMTKLRYLSLDGCKKLEELHLPEVASLTKVSLHRTSLKILPANIFQLIKLTELVIGSEFLTTLPTSLGNLSSLTTLKIQGCKKLESLPDSLEHLNFLRDLSIVESGVKCLPKSFIHLQSLRIDQTPISDLSYGPGCMLKTIVLIATKVTKISICGECCPFLETLKLSLNEDLTEVEILPATLKSLYVDKCKVLKDIRGVRGLENLKNLSIKYCEEVDGLSCFAELESLETFESEGCGKLKNIAGLQELRSLRELNIELDELPSLVELTSLRKIRLQKCNRWEKIGRSDHMRSLEELQITYCPELEALSNLGELTSLKKFELRKCHKLEKIEGLESLTSLEMLRIDDCPKLDALSGLAELTLLKTIILVKCNRLEKIEGLECLRSLEVLTLSYCPELHGLPSLGELTSLKQFESEKCYKLKNMEGLESLQSLKDLKISDCQELDGLPSLAQLISLEKFKLERCHKLKKIEGLRSPPSLKNLEISNCSELYGLPNLAELTSLRKFELEKCHTLKKLEGLKSFQSLKKLKILECQELDELPSLERLISLESFELGKCHKLVKLEGLRSLQSLKKLKIIDHLKLDGISNLAELTSLREFELKRCHRLKKVEGLENLQSLKKLKIKDCQELYGLPSLAKLISLENFELEKCHKLEKIEGLGSLQSLKNLKIIDLLEIDWLPSFTELTSLKELELRSCHKLKKIEGLESLLSLKKLKISNCQELDGFQSLAKLICLKNFELGKCHKLEKIEGLGSLRSLKSLKINDCPELDWLPSLAELTSLQEFESENCHKLKKLEGFESLQSLKKLKISNCQELDGLPSLAKLFSLENFKLRKCHKLEKIEDLYSLKSLKSLKIIDHPKLDGLPSLTELTSLKEFKLEKCHKLKRIEGLESLQSLKNLKISDCEELNEFPSLAFLISLQTLELGKCHKLEKIEGLGRLPSLKSLKIIDCPELDGLPNLAKLTSLNEFELEKCHKLKKIEGLEILQSLNKLKISDCQELDGIPSLPKLISLQYFELGKCHKLEKIKSLRSLRSLKSLKLIDRPELDGIPSFEELTSLIEFQLEKCHKLKKIEGLESLQLLKKLKISDCQELEGFSSLAKLFSLENFELGKCRKLENIEGLESLPSLKKLKIIDCPELNGLPSLGGLVSLNNFELLKCHKLEKIEGLDSLRSLKTLVMSDYPKLDGLPCLIGLLENLEVHSRSNAACIIGLEHSERLKSLVVVANDKPVVEPFISNIKKWPREVIICTRAVIDVGSLKNFFTSFPLKDVVEFGLIEGLNLRRSESPDHANVILICFIIDYVYPEVLLEISTDRGNRFYTELANGTWIWMGVFPQGSDWLQSSRYEIRASKEDKDVQVKEAWFVMGEEESILEAFHRLSQRLYLMNCSNFFGILRGFDVAWLFAMRLLLQFQILRYLGLMGLCGYLQFFDGIWTHDMYISKAM